MRVLLIEDDNQIAAFEKNILADHDITHVHTIHDAITAKIVLRHTYNVEFDLVLLDLKTPRRDGELQTVNFRDAVKVTHEQFPNTPIVIVSAFLDDDIVSLGHAYGMICVDKSLMAETQAFALTFQSILEAAKKMRNGSLTHHMTKKAMESAATDQDGDVPPMEQVKAKLYLAAGLSVISLPWLLFLYTMFARSVLHDNTPIPYYTETLMFCGLVIAAITGCTPWVLKFFGKK